MSTNTFFENFKQKMIEHGKYIKIPKGSTLRQLLGLDINKSEDKEEE